MGEGNWRRETNQMEENNLDGRILGRCKKRKSDGVDLGRCKKRKSVEGDDDVDLSWIAKASLSLVSDQQKYSAAAADGSGPILYIRVGTDTFISHYSDPTKSQWYLVPANDLETEPKPPQLPCDVSTNTSLSSLSPVWGSMPSGILMNSVAVALLPRIYVIGGGFFQNPSSLVYSYNLTSPHRGWERRPNMMLPRSCPSAVAVDGKIYVFGGIQIDAVHVDIRNPDNAFPNAEVYDPESDKWQVLLSHGRARSKDVVGFEHILGQKAARGGHALFMDEYYNKHIFVLSNSVFYMYDITADSMTVWEELSMTYDGNEGVVMDGILYLFQEHGPPRIIARDLRRRRWFRQPVQGLSKGFVLPDICGVKPFLYHIGNGRLCIVYGNPSPLEDDMSGTVLVVCSVVRVNQRTSRSSGEATLVATLESFKRYVVPGHELQDCLVL